MNCLYSGISFYTQIHRYALNDKKFLKEFFGKNIDLEKIANQKEGKSKWEAGKFGLSREKELKLMGLG